MKDQNKIINGKEISAAIRAELAEETAELIAKTGVQPGLAVIIVGENPASQVYVRNKHKASLECGFRSDVYELPESTTQEELNALVDRLNKDDAIHGILVQLPLPKHLSDNEIILRIDPKKDVDAFHPANVGRIMIGDYDYLPCTPAGGMELLHRSGVSVSGKKCVVVGRSNIVGKPMATLMMQKAYPGDATVTVCHSRSKDLVKECQEADILIAAMGQPNFVTADMVKEGAVVIDVGTTRVPDATRKSGFKLTGDVKFDEVAPKCSYITPVPGGVGPMTIVSLMMNTLLAGTKAVYK
jgi:methylenetetrahydrofolate dehydrogenase (NADP+)/methenyltetrahydrofolate cyclohydrolase